MMKCSSLDALAYYFSRLLKKSRGSAIRGSILDRTAKVESGSTVVNSSFARHSFCGYDCTILHSDIGSFCSIASNVSIGGVRHPIEFVSTSPVFLSHRDSVKAKFASHDYLPVTRTYIGNDVWIGEGAFLKAGISVGDGAVIGMGAVVTKNVLPYSIIAGNPAHLIRMRFEQDVIDALLRMKWWELPDSELRRLGSTFNEPRLMLLAEGFL